LFRGVYWIKIINKEEIAMLQWYDYVFRVISFIIIILSLLQGGKSEGASGAITGGGLNVFVKTKERGGELIISYLTLGFGVIFLFFALLSSVLTKTSTSDSSGDTTTTEIRFLIQYLSTIL
jgi:preprotein translocase subunit SecG